MLSTRFQEPSNSPSAELDELLTGPTAGPEAAELTELDLRENFGLN